ncbi:TPA: ATP-binding protein [Streptococcus suis]
MEKEYPIKISPEILELLGPSLYTNIYYVLAELVANSYDADAENVWITISDSSIIIEDDGKGMTYQETVERYLSVAKPTRINEITSKSDKYNRPKMGRKGIGKLAALAVSSKVKVMTKSGDEQSGFWLTRNVPSNGNLEPITEGEIYFDKIVESGTRIEMLNSEFEIPKTSKTIKNNLSKFFPQLSDNKTNPFAIHIKGKDGKIQTSKKFVDSLATSLDSLIVFGKDEYGIIDKFKEESPKYSKDNFRAKDSIRKSYLIKNREGIEESRTLEVKGWIGTYHTTRGLKAKESSDFPDNFLAIYSHGKLGQFNVLNEIGQNRLNEVYVVGQLYVDEFEETSLPDMALSNRQGYKSDDVRYKYFLEIASDILNQILRKKDWAIKLKNKNNEESKRKKKQAGEKEFAEQVKDVIKMFDDAVPENKLDVNLANDMLQSLGVKKRKVDEESRKILLSHTRQDQKLNNILYGLLLINGFEEDEIIYTSDPQGRSGVPYNQNIWDYFQDFFIKSYSDKPIYVLYVHSNNSADKRGVLLEMGAGWVVKTKHGIIKAGKEDPKEPLEISTVFPSVYIDDTCSHVVTTENHFRALYEMLGEICKMFDKNIKTFEKNIEEYQKLGGEFLSEYDFFHFFNK